MRRGRIFIYLALLLIVGVGAAFLLLPRLTNPGSAPDQVDVPTATPVLMVDVIVVGQPIALGNKITPEYLITVKIPQDQFIDGLYMTDIEKAVGRVARYDLQQGVFLNPNYLVDTLEQAATTVSDISFQIEKGKVAVSVPMTRLSGVSYALRPGDRVNVIVTLLLVDVDRDFQSKSPNNTAGILAPGPGFLLGYSQKDQTTAGLTTDEKLRSITAQIVGGGAVASLGKAFEDPLLGQTFYLVPSEEQRPRLVSQTLIQNVKVLYVGTYQDKEKVQAAPGESDGLAATNTPAPAAGQPQPAQATPTPERPDLITLVVTPQDAVTLNYLLYAGAQLNLALRPVDDTDVVDDINAVTLSYLLEKYNIVRPERLDIAIEPRIDEVVQPELPNDNIATPIP
jgi:pilus assembly protein CpaB